MKECKYIGLCSICCCENKPSLFNGLSEDDFDELHSERKEISFKPGEIIFKQGTALTHFACFREGFAKIYYERPEGSNILVNIVGSGYLCESMGMFTDNIHHLTTQALTTVKLCLIATKNFDALLRSNQEMAIELISMKNKQSINLTTKLANLTYKNMAGRVADVLLYLRNDIYKADEFVLNLSRQDLADLAAMSKESFIRTLKEMRDAGILEVHRDDVKIIKLRELKQLSAN
ncbi:MAG: Crp/Fnr family transcriptional regulator [Bacteroidales bacterium]|nr:Crp/Fnr family transcriptional regulator [Bacteroidales bacterium]